MGAKILKHHEEHLDGTRGKWRLTFQARKSALALDGHPQDWDVGVVVSCPSCGCQFGVGFDADGPKIGADGKTDRPVKCMNHKGCPWTEFMEFELFDDASTKDAVGKKKSEHLTDVKDARLRSVHERVLADMQAELHERAMVEAKKIIVDGDPEQDKKLIQFMKTAKKIG